MPSPVAETGVCDSCRTRSLVFVCGCCPPHGFRACRGCMESGYVHNHEFAFSRNGHHHKQEQSRQYEEHGHQEDRTRKFQECAQPNTGHPSFRDVQNVHAFHSTPLAKPLVVCRDVAEDIVMKKRNRDWDEMDPTSTADMLMFDAYTSPNIKRVKACPHSSEGPR
jgi:hypothetical protein